MSSIRLKPFAVNVKFSVKPDKRDDFLSLIKDIQKKTLATEPAALQFLVGEHISTPNTFYMHAQFVGEEGFKAHRLTPHSGEWQKFSSDALFSEDGEPAFDFYFAGTGTGTPHEAEKVEISIPSSICVHTELCVKPELREVFLEVVRNNQRGSNSNEDEPLCLQYVYGESKDEPNKFLFHEAYTGIHGGKEGFEAHFVTAHFEKWQEFMDLYPFTEAPVVNTFKTLQ